MFLIDNNLSPKLCKRLEGVFPGCVHVFDVGLQDSDDEIVWEFALKNSLHILTKDMDFVNLVHYHGFPPKVVRLNCGNQTTEYIISLIDNNQKTIQAFLDAPDLGLLVIH